jgi:hypothetical protein
MRPSDSSPVKLETSPRVGRWLAFVRAHGHPCFTGWPDNIVIQWLRWHAHNRSLIVICQGEEILGLATGWQCFVNELEQHWYADNPRGDCFYISHAIATSPAALADLLVAFNERWPHWRALKIYWRRAGKGLISVPPQTISKLFSLAQRKGLATHTATERQSDENSI